MKCKHEKTYKLFYMSCLPKRAWKKTIYSVCRECGALVVRKNIEVAYETN